MAGLVLSPDDFSRLEGARVVEAEGTPSGKAVLIEEPEGYAAITLKLGESGSLPHGLYDVSLQVGTRDGSLKWAALHAFPGGWFTGFVEAGDLGSWRWRERTQPIPIAGRERLRIEVRSKGGTGVHIGQVSLQRTKPCWPSEMISDHDFFAGLDDRFPALQAVVSASETGDYAKASSEFIEYLRRSPRKIDGRLGGTVASQPVEKTGESPSSVARLLLDDRMVLLWDPHGQPNYCTCEAYQIPPTEFSFADPKDWHAIYANPGRRWYGWYLSANLDNLCSAYAATGDERFARKAMDLIRRWIEVWGPFPKAFYAEEGYPNEYYTSASFGQTHSTHCWGWSSGVRHGMVEAIWNVVKTTGGCGSITDRERVDALKLALILTRYVQNVRDHQNGVHPKYVWLVQAGNWLPEIREIAEMSDNAPWALMSFMDDCHYPDGAYNELCYHRHSRFAEAAREAAAQGKDMGSYLEKFRKCFDFNIWFTKPMGNFPWINDEGHGKHVDPEEPSERLEGYIQMACELYPDDPHLQYIHTRGAKGDPPPELSRNFPWSGFMIMRTGWQPDDLHLIFDGGRNTSSHNHMDQMNVVLTAYGSTLLCDAGYVGTGFSAPDRKYYINHPRSHNLLVVDNLAQIPDTPDGEDLIGWRAFGNVPADNRWLTTEGYDYAETCYNRRYRQDYESPDAYVQPASQERRLLFFKPSTGTPYWLVWDIVRPRDSSVGDHDLQLLFHFTPTSSARVLGDPDAVVNVAENAELLIMPLSDSPWEATIVKGDARPEANTWQGFVSGGFGNPLVPTECAVFAHSGPLPVGVATVLFPYRRGKTPEVSARLLPVSADASPLAIDKAFAMEITLPDGRDVVLAQDQAGTLLQFDGLACDARAAALRYDRLGDLVGILLVEGSTLRIDGEEVLNVQRPDTRCVVLGPGEAVPCEGVTVSSRRLSVTSID